MQDYLSLFFEFIQKQITPFLYSGFESLCTVTIRTCPRLLAIHVHAFIAVMSDLNFENIEIVFPVWLFFFERRRTITDLDPTNPVVFKLAACCISRIYSPPTTDPLTKVPVSIACNKPFTLLGLTEFRNTNRMKLIFRA